MTRTKNFIWITLILLLPFFAKAEIVVPSYFSSHMVMQRGKPLVVFGVADPGEKVTGTFRSETVSVMADNQGDWSITFKQGDAGGPYQMRLEGSTNSFVFDDVYLGDVWFCSGQSNMGWKVINANNGENEVKSANYGQLKLFTVPRHMASSTKDLPQGGIWEDCTPESIGEFSAVAYFFGRELYRELDVPIGLIHSSWGGTNIESWMDGVLFKDYPNRLDSIQKFKGMDLDSLMDDYNEKAKNYSEYLDANDMGSRERWWDKKWEFDQWDVMDLPSLWKDTHLEKTYGVVWVAKEVELSEVEAQQKGALSLGRIDDEDVTFINGVKIGESTNKDIPRWYDIPQGTLKKGKNVVLIKTKNLRDIGGFRSAAEDLYMKLGNIKLDLSGPWFFKIGVPRVKEPPFRVHPNNHPSSLYNAMVNPFFRLAIKGVIWYQGESNAGNPEEYAQFFPSLIADWRDNWKNQEMPFIFAQLANYSNQNGRWPWIREAQAKATQLPYTAMVTTIDVGDDFNIHPTNKQIVGLRMANAAMALDGLGSRVLLSGPKLLKLEIGKNGPMVSFDRPILIKGNDRSIEGFAVAGEQGEFREVIAKKVGNNSVVLKSPGHLKIEYVRYLWDDAPPKVMIFGEDGLPVSPFRTDTFKRE
ncbi:hypothetical protein D2V93_07530 [Flagellimonas taeanensis]|uniref:sialate O-acetylesterase n=1 Tax=Flavobacteriaceae TaxID=49546 RepID=UPI000E69611A|nr:MULTISPECIES: sialate O-acetylesterase [Allomuricauda]MDC6386606.1 sialate O-acetylesterase [Muricauda sp. SK9]RIV51322.1 hypothetical protein D2V93_07530 [Allomuricauda taeanensis]